MSSASLRSVRVWLDDRHDPHDPTSKVTHPLARFHCFSGHNAIVELPNGSVLVVSAYQIQFTDGGAP